MSEVVEFPGLTTLDIPPAKILTGAQEADLEAVIVIGIQKNGEGYYATSAGDDPMNLWLIEKFKKRLLED